MSKRVRQSTLAFSALLFWLFASGSGLHGHYCFDGTEPPFSVHFDLAIDHDQDTYESGRRDLDSKPMEMSLLKLLSLDLPFLTAALLLIFLYLIVRELYSAYFKIPLTWSTPTGIRPPLRAPPINSH